MRGKISNLESAVMGIIGFSWKYNGHLGGCWKTVRCKLGGAIDALNYGTEDPIPGLEDELIFLRALTLDVEFPEPVTSCT